MKVRVCYCFLHVVSHLAENNATSGSTSAAAARQRQCPLCVKTQVQLKELFRLADPDHSKSIDLEEFRTFLSDLRSLEHEPKLFQQEVELRIGRSSRVNQERRESKILEMGLLSESYVAIGGGNNSRRRFRVPGRAMSMGRVVTTSKEGTGRARRGDSLVAGVDVEGGARRATMSDAVRQETTDGGGGGGFVVAGEDEVNLELGNNR